MRLAEKKLSSGLKRSIASSLQPDCLLRRHQLPLHLPSSCGLMGEVKGQLNGTQTSSSGSSHVEENPRHPVASRLLGNIPSKGSTLTVTFRTCGRAVHARQPAHRFCFFFFLPAVSGRPHVPRKKKKGKKDATHGVTAAVAGTL